MAIQWSVSVRNGRLDAIEVAMGTAAKLQLWTGAPPANVGTAASGTKIAEYSLASDWAAAASGGVKALNGLPLETTAIVGGTIGYYRFTATDGTTAHEQGTVATSGGDMTVDNATVTTGQTIRITAFSKTEPGA